MYEGGVSIIDKGCYCYDFQTNRRFCVGVKKAECL